MATKTIQSFKVQTRLETDAKQHHAEYKKAEADVTHYTDHLKKAGKDAGKAFDGAKAGGKFGKDFGASAMAEIGSSFSVSTLGGLIGTAIAPGIGTAIGSAIGGGVDTAISKVAPIILQTIDRGIELNKLLEDTRVEFTQLTGSEAEANKYLGELLGISKDLGILPAVVVDTSEKLSDLTGDLKLTRTLLKAAADQAADFGGTSFDKVASDLGLIAERGELIARDFKTLLKDGIQAKKYLTEATGLSEKQLDKLIAAGRIRGDVATRLIAEGIEREKGGLAAYKTSQTVSGRERQFRTLTDLRSAEGTVEATRGIGDFYEKANAVLDSPQAKAFVSFVNDYSSKLIDFTENALKVGVSVGAGVAEGILNFSPASMMQSFTKLEGFVTSGLKSVFEIRSPSELTAREIGEPLVEGIEQGMVDRTSKGFAKWRDALEKAGGEAFTQAVEAMAKRLGVDPSWLLNIMASESGFKPSAKNPLPGQTATGLIQFTEGTAKHLGTSTSKLRNMSALQQLPYVEKYFSPFAGRLHSQGDLYGAAFLPKQLGQDVYASRGSREYGLNRQLDIGNKGYITRGDLASVAQKKGGFSGGGTEISASNPLPVVVVSSGMNPGTGEFAAANYASYMAGTDQRTGVQQAMDWAQAQKEVVGTYTEQIPAIVDGVGRNQELLTTTVQLARAEDLQMRALPPLTQAQKTHAATSIELTKQYQEASRQELIKGQGVLTELSGYLGQAAGMIPGQEVGKKRSLFSKILGVAAPFLSFIPGVGPILSTVAGIASNALGGNYAGAVSGIAGGLQSGGVFRSSGGGAGHAPAPEHRASGGPVYRGRSYVVGEARPELFEPKQDGWIHPSAGGGGSGLSSAVDRLHTLLSRLESMPAHEVVRMGARGMIDAYDSDADLIRLSGQRHRLA